MSVDRKQGSLCLNLVFVSNVTFGNTIMKEEISLCQKFGNLGEDGDYKEIQSFTSPKHL
jgi:hypothetical protein